LIPGHGGPGGTRGNGNTGKRKDGVMAKGEKRKAEKVKRVRLMKRHRDAILAAFGRAVDERFNAAARECFTGLVTDAMRKVFSGDELRAFNAAPEELAARLADTECCIYPQNEKTWDQVTVKVTPMKARKGCRIPYRFAVPRAVVDKADAHKRRLEQERDEAKVLAFRIVAAFARLWDGIYAGRGFGWDADPWVWVIGFRVAEVRR
jgi:hypothetical protein